MEEGKLQTLLARQGIYDKDGLIYAYELLYRNDDSNDAPVESVEGFSGDTATSSVIAHLFTNLNIDTIIGNKVAFINFTRNHFLQDIPNLLPNKRIAIEVLETVKVDTVLIDKLISLSQLGYTIALDDFVFNEETKILVEIADIIKIDVLHLNETQIRQKLEPLREFKGQLIAEKVEEKQQFELCVELGFDYFQGFFLNKPDPLKGQAMTENKALLLLLLSELNQENTHIDKVAEIISKTPTLNYRILRLASSASFYTGAKVDTLSDAIKRLGFTQICNWVVLIMLASMDEVKPDLVDRTIIRAKMCESLSETMGHSNPSQAYTVGILSTLEAILHEPMPLLLSKLQLSAPLNNALIDQSGELGKILTYATNYETANFDQLDDIGINHETLSTSYLHALQHANEMRNNLK